MAPSTQGAQGCGFTWAWERLQRVPAGSTFMSICLDPYLQNPVLGANWGTVRNGTLSHISRSCHHPLYLLRKTPSSLGPRCVQKKNIATLILNFLPVPMLFSTSIARSLGFREAIWDGFKRKILPHSKKLISSSEELFVNKSILLWRSVKCIVYSR